MHFCGVFFVDKAATAVLLHAVDERARVGANRHRHQRAGVEQPQSCCTSAAREERKGRAPQQREHPYGGFGGIVSELYFAYYVYKGEHDVWSHRK